LNRESYRVQTAGDRFAVARIAQENHWLAKSMTKRMAIQPDPIAL
jgi:hypothetical protein